MKGVSYIIETEIHRGAILVPMGNELIANFITSGQIRTWVGSAFYAKDGLVESNDYIFSSSRVMGRWSLIDGVS